MVCDYSSVQREIKAYEALSKSAEISEAPGKLYVRRALDHFELSQGDRNYHFLIHERASRRYVAILSRHLSRKSSHFLRQGIDLPDAACFGIYS